MKTTVVRRPTPAFARIAMGIAVIAGSVLSALAAGALFSSVRAVLIAVPISAVLAAKLMQYALSLPVRLRVEGGRLHGLPTGASVALGDARVHVESWAERLKWVKGEPWRRYFQVKLRSDSGIATLTSRSLDALATRTYAEAVAKAGQFSMSWSCDHRDLQTRTPDELDLPLARRLLQRPELVVGHDAPSGMRTVVEPCDNGGVRLCRPFPRSYIAGAALVALFAWIILGLPMAFESPAGFAQSAGALLVIGAVCVGTASVVLVIGYLFPRDLLVGPSQVTRRVLLFRALPFPLWRIETGAIESLHLVRVPSAEIAFAGDGIYRSVGIGSIAEALHLRGVIQSALTGGRVVPMARVRGAPARAMGTATSAPAAMSTDGPVADAPRADAGELCPRCVEPPLQRIGGPLDELACAQCGGRFLSPQGTQRLLEQELGMEKDFLRTLTGFFAGERLSCPGCRSKTSPVRLKGVTADLCTGCGALWLDAGELGVVSEGRYAEAATEEPATEAAAMEEPATERPERVD